MVIVKNSQRLGDIDRDGFYIGKEGSTDYKVRQYSPRYVSSPLHSFMSSLKELYTDDIMSELLPYTDNPFLKLKPTKNEK